MSLTRDTLSKNGDLNFVLILENCLSWVKFFPLHLLNFSRWEQVAITLGRLTQVLELHWNLLTLLCQSAMKSRQPKTCFLCLKYGTSNMHIFFSKLLEMFVTHSRTYVFLNLNIIIIFNPLHSNFPGGLHLFLIS